MVYKKQKSAFTLVELIVVITILAILGTIAFISLQGYSRDSRDSVRLADMGSIKSSLELYKLEGGKYPETTNGSEITYSGSEAWLQGTFGESTFKNVVKLDSIPLDPLTDKEYIYSVTNTRQEYQIAGIFEGDIVSLNSIKETYAGDKTAFLKVEGNYNGKLLKVSTGSIDYILAVPSIITSTGGTLEYIIDHNKLAYNGYKNLPFQYYGSQYTVEGETSPINLVNSGSFIVYEGDVKELSVVDNSSIRKTFIEKLQDAYTTTRIVNEGPISAILVTDTNDVNATEILSSSIVRNNLGGKLIVNSSNNSLPGYEYPIGWTVFNIGNSLLSTNDMTNVSEDTQGNIWIGSRGGGAYKIKDGVFTKYMLSSGICSNDIFGVFSDSDSNTWFINWGGDSACKYNGTTFTSYNPLNSGLPASWGSETIQDNSGNIWFGTDGGTAKFNGTTWTVYNTSNSGLPSNQVYGLDNDSVGNMWFATSGGGIAKFNGTTWTVFNIANSGFPTNNINKVTVFGDNDVWFGTYGGGVLKYNGTTWTNYNTSNSTIATNYIGRPIKDNNGLIWFSSNAGAITFNGTTWSVYNTGNSGIPSNGIESVFQDSRGNYWFGTANGVAVYNPS